MGLSTTKTALVRHTKSYRYRPTSDDKKPLPVGLWQRPSPLMVCMWVVKVEEVVRMICLGNVKPPIIPATRKTLNTRTEANSDST